LGNDVHKLQVFAFVFAEVHSEDAVNYVAGQWWMFITLSQWIYCWILMNIYIALDGVITISHWTIQCDDCYLLSYYTSDSGAALLFKHGYFMDVLDITMIFYCSVIHSRQ